MKSGANIIPMSGNHDRTRRDCEAEQQTISLAMTYGHSAAFTDLSHLAPEDFYLDSHRKIWATILEMHNEGTPIDVVTVARRLADQQPQPLGYWAEQLTKSEVHGYQSDSCSYWAKQVKTAARRRKLRTAARDFYERLDDGHNPDELLPLFENVLYGNGTDQGKAKKSTTSLKEALLQCLERAEAAQEDGVSGGVETGFIDLDRILGRLQPQNFVVLAARPAMGKSALADQIALNVAKTLRESGDEGCVLFMSMEMSAVELARRHLSRAAGVPSQMITEGTLSDHAWSLIHNALGDLMRPVMEYLDNGASTVGELRATCRRLEMSGTPVRLIVIDYLQLMRAPGHKSKTEEVTEISRSLKLLAKSLNIPVIALSQLNRDSAKRPDKRPLLCDLRDSGAIEQDGDIIMFLHREEYYNPDTDQKGIGEVIVGKSRSGKTGTAYLGWQGDTTRFVNLKKEEPWR